MATQESMVTRVLHLVSDLRAREKELKAALEEVQLNIEAVQRTSALLREEDGLSAEPSDRESVNEELRNMSYHEALVMLAGSNNGRIKVKDAKRILLEAGAIANPKTAYQQLTARLVRSNHFVRVAPGEYELLSEPTNGHQRAFQ